MGESPTQCGIIEDQIQETFVLAWQHTRKLQAHPNPNGWLVETFRRCLMAQCRKLGKEQKRQAFSLADASIPSPERFANGAKQIALLHRLLGEKDADIPFIS